MEKNESIAPALILVVDDDPVACLLLRETLERAGFAVIEALDGVEGCRLYEEHHPDLLFVDIIMPRMDGYELCRELRNRPDGAYVPIVMVTALDDVSSIARAYDAGATDFMSKPIDWALLNYRVRYILRAEELHRNQERLKVCRVCRYYRRQRSSSSGNHQRYPGPRQSRCR